MRILERYKPLILSAAGPLMLKIGAAFLGLSLNYFAAHTLPTNEFGVFSLCQVLILALLALSKVGLENTTLKLVASARATKNHHNIAGIYTLALAIILIALSITALLILNSATQIAEYIIRQSAVAQLFPVILMILIPSALIAINASVMRAFQRPNLSILFGGFITLVLTNILIVIYQPKSASALLWLMCIANYAACLCSFIVCLATLKLRFKLTPAPFKAITHSCLPLWTSTIVAVIVQHFSTFVVARYSPIAELGIYSVALKVAALMSFVLFAVNAVVAPRFAALYANGDRHQLKELARHSGQLLLACAISMCLLLWLFADPIMGLFGKEFVQGAIYLKILALGQLVNVGTGSVVNLLIMTGHEKLHQRNTILIAILTCCLALILVPFYGAIGAATTTAVAMASQNLLSYYYTKHRI
jgi:O-antigen/teichoic acid export membrane protein